MAKKGILAAALQETANKRPKIEQETALVEAQRPVAATRRGRGGTTTPPSRIGKAPLVGYVDPAIAAAVKHLAVDQASSVQALMEEAVGDLLAKHGRTVR